MIDTVDGTDIVSTDGDANGRILLMVQPVMFMVQRVMLMVQRVMLMVQKVILTVTEDGQQRYCKVKRHASCVCFLP
jgi:hypothetical protein